VARDRDAAAIHLPHRSGIASKPFAATVLRDRQPVVIHLWRREQGLLSPPGNPDRICGPADLPLLRIARRRFGTGTRILLDRLLAQSGIPPDHVSGPEAGSHLEVAVTVATGRADTGLGVRATATALDLDFIPAAWEDFDLILSGAMLAAAEPLLAALRDPAVQVSVQALGAYDSSQTGTVEVLAGQPGSATLPRVGQRSPPSRKRIAMAISSTPSSRRISRSGRRDCSLAPT